MKKFKKDNFEENHKKNKNKKNRMEKHSSNQQCFKEINYKTKFSINLILKK
jgi:hypothetical protein